MDTHPLNHNNTKITKSILSALCVFVVMLAAISTVSAQSPPPTLSPESTIETELAQHSVFCTLQDSRGFMWFGTEAGLNK